MADAKAKAESCYGKVPAAEYLAAIKSFSQPIEEENFRTLREDYSIGIWKGAFEVSYAASCKICGFQHQFKTEKEMKI